MVKVSVVVPIYGVEKYIHQCVDSILAQSLKDIEIILVDDGSKDRCPQIVDEYAAKDKRVIAIHLPNGGYGRACNTGIAASKGEYISIIEPDDFIDCDMYKDLYNIAQKNNSDIVKSGFYHNFDTPKIKETVLEKFSNKIPVNTFTIYECSLFLYNHPSIWSCIYKRNFIEKHNIRFVEAPGAGWTDNPFQVQTMCLAERINYTPKAYYYWRRVNLYDSEDLKDYTIPFKRSDEIHEWLDSRRIKNESILAALYKRELGYINIVLGMKDISNKKDCYAKIKTMCSRMSKDIIQQNILIEKKEKKQYMECLENVSLYNNKKILKKILKKMRRFMFELLIKPKKQEFLIQFFGFRVSKNKSLNTSYIYELKL